RCPNALGRISIFNRFLTDCFESSSLASSTAATSTISALTILGGPFLWEGLPKKCSASKYPGAWSPQEGQVSKAAAVATAIFGVRLDSTVASSVFVLAFLLVLAKGILPRPFLVGGDVLR